MVWTLGACIKKFGIAAILITPTLALSAQAGTLAAQKVGDSIPPRGAPWITLRMGISLPQPFGNTELMMRRKNRDGETVVTSIVVILNSHTVTVSKALLHGLVMNTDPEVSYEPQDLRHGRLSKFSIWFQYGYPTKVSKWCVLSPPPCEAYHVAQFTVDRQYHVKRENHFLQIPPSGSPKAREH